MVDGIAIGDDGLARCWWADGDPLNRAYHDTEWGRPVSDDRRLFEKLCLEGFQSGLSWLTILRKRPNFRHAFHDFDPAAVAAFDDADVERLMSDRAQALGDKFSMREFMDAFDAVGLIPMSLVRWEVMGRPDDAIRRVPSAHETAARPAGRRRPRRAHRG